MNNTMNYQTVAAPGSISLKRKLSFKDIASRFTVTNISIPHIVVFLFAMFLVTAITLCTLSAQIYQLNNEVAALEAEYANLMTVNDELSGKIMEQCSIGEVEAYATGVLGMRKATRADYEYMRYSDPAADNVMEAEVEDDGGFLNSLFGWLGN